MIIQYKFQVRSNLAFQDDVAFQFKGRTYFFETQDHRLSSIIVRVKGDAKEEAPKVSTEEGSSPAAQKLHIKYGNSFPFIQMELRNLEGILGPYGVEEIDLFRPEVSWIPENEEEKKDVHIKRWKTERNEQLSPQFPADVMARSIIAAYDAFDIEVPLIFYRKAFSSYRNARYLEVCYDYFFFLESLFADSAVKKVDVQRNFRCAPKLQSAIEGALNDQLCLSELRRASEQKLGRLKAKTIGEISDFLVEYRGEIHHYKARHKKKWHPGNPQEAEFEATLYKHIAGEIALNLALDELYHERVDLTGIRMFQRTDERSA